VLENISDESGESVSPSHFRRLSYSLSLFRAISQACFQPWVVVLGRPSTVLLLFFVSLLLFPLLPTMKHIAHTILPQLGISHNISLLLVAQII
jgi:hypothetical protein